LAVNRFPSRTHFRDRAAMSETSQSTYEESSMNTSIRSNVRTALACAIGGILWSTLPVSAAFSADKETPPARTVSYSDLNIHSAAGARILYRRIRTAAIEVCHFRDSWDLALKNLREACIKSAVDEAVRVVPSQELAALHGVVKQRDVVVAASR
jgi:UrcA family protein